VTSAHLYNKNVMNTNTNNTKVNVIVQDEKNDNYAVMQIMQKSKIYTINNDMMMLNYMPT